MTRQTVVMIASVAALSGAAGYALRARAEGPPRTNPLFYKGALLDSTGAPVTGTKAVAVSLYDDENTGALLCSSAPVTVNLTPTKGQFRIPLSGGTGDCVQAVHATSDVWVAVSVDGVLPVGRTKLGAVPYALEADHALTARSVPGLDSPRAVIDQVNAALAAGARLNAGVQGTHVVPVSANLPVVPAGATFPEAAVEALCPPGEKLLGGGCATHHSEWLLWINAPRDQADGWACRAKNVSNAFAAGMKGSTLTGPFVAYAVCAP
jgi:hypothetical protein